MWWEPWLIVSGLAAGALLVGVLFDKVVLEALRGMARRTKTELDDLLIRAVHPALGILVTVLAFQAGLQLFPDRIPPSTATLWSRVILALGILVFAVIAARLATGLLQYTTGRKPLLVPVARIGTRVLNVAIYTVAFLVILGSYGISITPLVTSLGIAGLAVALALQDTLSNFFSGVWIQTGRAMQPGHYVRLEEHKLEGFVEEVGWRTTKIRQLTDNVIVVPNSKFAQAIVIDYDLPDPRSGASLQFVVAADADVRKVMQMLAEEATAAARSVSGILLEPPPSANFSGFTENGLQVSLGFHVRRYVDQFAAQNEIRLRVLERFRKEGVDVPAAVRDVRITAMPAEAPVGRKAKS